MFRAEKNAKTRATDRWNRPTDARTFKKYNIYLNIILWFVTGVAETAVDDRVDGVRRMGRRKIVFIDARAKKLNKIVSSGRTENNDNRRSRENRSFWGRVSCWVGTELKKIISS